MNSSAILFLALVANGACQKAETAEAAAAATTISEEQLIEAETRCCRMQAECCSEKFNFNLPVNGCPLFKYNPFRVVSCAANIFYPNEPVLTAQVLHCCASGFNSEEGRTPCTEVCRDMFLTPTIAFDEKMRRIGMCQLPSATQASQLRNFKKCIRRNELLDY